MELRNFTKSRRPTLSSQAEGNITVSDNCEVTVASTESEGQSCFTMTIQSTGESLWFLERLLFSSMTYNNKTEEIKRATGSRIQA